VLQVDGPSHFLYSAGVDTDPLSDEKALDKYINHGIASNYLEDMHCTPSLNRKSTEAQLLLERHGCKVRRISHSSWIGLSSEERMKLLIDVIDSYD
jgi:hypothetical protein